MSKQKEPEKESERLIKLKKLAILCDRIRDDELRWDAGEIVEELIKEEIDKGVMEK
jgi:anti-sigma28 factor (negative regulator of flagellin synthesis)